MLAKVRVLCNFLHAKRFIITKMFLRKDKLCQSSVSPYYCRTSGRGSHFLGNTRKRKAVWYLRQHNPSFQVDCSPPWDAGEAHMAIFALILRNGYGERCYSVNYLMGSAVAFMFLYFQLIIEHDIGNLKGITTLYLYARFLPLAGMLFLEEARGGGSSYG